MQNKIENYTKLKKLKGYLRNGDATISFWAILFSTMFYISIFFFFDIPISSLINTTKFWFLISNTLILIIAADFGAFFSSTSNEEIFYEDYVRRTHARNVPCFENNYIKNNPQIVTTAEETKEHIKDVVVVEKVALKEVNLAIISKCEWSESPIREKKAFKKVKESQGRIKTKSIKVDHRYSDKGGIMVGDEEKEIVLRRSKSERHTPETEESEFSAMSVEELNRRVEDFIQRFNQEIRLQAAKNRQNSKMLNHIHY
ncbi:hypothetical protein LIER_00258 [Lithospermum erythrorhizon]|uniref:Uncharacterized protein n=1 Tax=Lithospermum erythrorhizon TaxID=34254 RepID=A0AAV3NL81_LITER